jgi:uncharacterized protein
MRRVGLLCIVAVLTVTGVACRKECAVGAACAQPPGERAPVVTIGAAPNARTFSVEVAATPAARRKGLMNRSDLPAAAGMLFLFPKPVRLGFWMKNTLIDLDIAFISGDRVVEVRRMTPCRVNPCPQTTPSAAYDRALEVRAGTLDSVRPGDPVQVQGNLPKPS